MIWTIAKKEFYEKILDFRVVISIVIALTVTVVVAVVVGEDYRASKTSYDQEVTAAESEFKDMRVYSEFSRRLVFAPSPLSVLSRGSGLAAPLSVPVSPTKVPRFEPTVNASNIYLRIFDNLDLVTLFRVLFALLVILLSYDAFTGEKESGTLRLVMSTSVSRLNVFLGKTFGILLVVAALNAITYALAMLSIGWVSGISFAPADYLRALLALFATLLYMLVFAMLGMCTSLLFRQSSTSLVVSLFLWFVIAIVQPNLNSFAAAEFSNIPRFKDVEPFLEARQQEVDKVAEQIDSHNRTPNNSRIMYGSTREMADAEYEVLERAVRIAQLQSKYIDAADDGWKRYQELYLQPLQKQASLNSALDCFSPAALFKRCISVLSRTDIQNVETFFDKARQYRSQCIEYLGRKGVYSTNAQLFFSRLRKEDINPEATSRRMERYQKDPSAIPWPVQQPPLDVSDAPSYQLTEPSLSADMSRIAFSAGLLLLYSMLLGGVAVAALSKFDVR